MKSDVDYMLEAICLARHAADLGEIPVGAVIVKDGKIIGRGYNTREQSHSILGHAEIMAIQEAAGILSDWRLSDCDLYVTLEPCPMCAGALLQARIRSIHYGAKDSVMGACGSVLNLFEENFGHHPAMYYDSSHAECSQLLTDFFKNKRDCVPAKHD